MATGHMEAPPPGQHGEQQQRPTALKQSAPPGSKRQLPESGLRVSWRSPTPIREEPPPTVTIQPKTWVSPIGQAGKEKSDNRSERGYNWNTLRWKPKPWANLSKQKGKGKGKSKSGEKGKAKGQTKSKR